MSEDNTYNNFMTKFKKIFPSINPIKKMHGDYNGRTCVFKCINDKNGKFYTYKLFPIEFKEDAIEYNNLPFHTVQNELMKLKHPNIMKTIKFSGEYDFNKQGPGLGYIISEFYEGFDSKDVFEVNNPQTNLLIVLEAGEGIYYMHEQGLSHGDLKAKNIICSEEEGIIVIDNEVNSKRDHPLWDTFGTPLNSPPEQIFNQKSRITPKSDTFSLGQLICNAFNPKIFSMKKDYYSKNNYHLAQLCSFLKSEDFPETWVNIFIPNEFSDFKELLIKMLQPDHKKRIGFRESYQELEKTVYDHFNKSKKSLNKNEGIKNHE